MTNPPLKWPGPPAQQADATRTPSGLTQKLQSDVDRKKGVLAQEGEDAGAPGPLVNAATGRAFWGRNPLGSDPSKQDEERDFNVRQVGKSLDETVAALAASKKADDDKRNQPKTYSSQAEWRNAMGLPKP
jgi:hypothetical protein